MKKIFYILAFCASFASFAQQSPKQPLVIIDGMLASNTMINNDKKNIQKMDVYKTPANIPQNLKSFEKLATNGLISVTAKEMYYDRMSLEQINEGFQLPAVNPVYFDGNLIENTKLLVIPNALENMSVELINGKKYVSLSTLSKVSSANAIK